MGCGEKGSSHPPIKVFYYHYHNSIRLDLTVLSKSVVALESSNSDDVVDCLTELKGRVAFLERVYNIHSSVEDEVDLCCLSSLWPRTIPDALYIGESAQLLPSAVVALNNSLFSVRCCKTRYPVLCRLCIPPWTLR